MERFRSEHILLDWNDLAEQFGMCICHRHLLISYFELFAVPFVSLLVSGCAQLLLEFRFDVKKRILIASCMIIDFDIKRGRISSI